jgi:hypothetical protein
MVRQTRKTAAIHRWGERCFQPSPHGLVPHVHKGKVPSQEQSLARYVAPSVVSPPIAVRRLEREDGEWGTSHDRSHRSERVERDTIDVPPCIGRMMQHTRPQGCKRIR